MKDSFTEKEAADYLKRKGWGVIPPGQYLTDLEDDFLRIWDKVRNYTMISVERGYSLYKSVEYVAAGEISGDFVECGVWKGGSCMLMAFAMEKFGLKDRKIYMYDTFSGMTEPTDEDTIAWNGIGVLERWKKNEFSSWAVGMNDVKRNIKDTLGDLSPFVFIKGDVSVTLNNRQPENIAILRLDTDWYESTAVELKILYPLLSRGGVLQIDDYGHFKGARKAVDEYFSKNPVFLSRVDYTGREAVKP